jgi:hypothetical protein
VHSKFDIQISLILSGWKFDRKWRINVRQILGDKFVDTMLIRLLLRHSRSYECRYMRLFLLQSTDGLTVQRLAVPT